MTYRHNVLCYESVLPPSGRDKLPGSPTAWGPAGRSTGGVYSRPSCHPHEPPKQLSLFRCILFPHWKCVCVCVCVCVCALKEANETLSEPQPVPLAMIMTTLSRAIERQQNKIVVCFPFTSWALRQKRQREKSEIKIWHFSGRGMGEVFYFSLLFFLNSSFVGGV